MQVGCRRRLWWGVVSVDELYSVVDELAALLADVGQALTVLDRRCDAIERKVMAQRPARDAAR